jgi:hypothetical protein
MRDLPVELLESRLAAAQQAGQDIELLAILTESTDGTDTGEFEFSEPSPSQTRNTSVSELDFPAESTSQTIAYSSSFADGMNRVTSRLRDISPLTSIRPGTTSKSEAKISSPNQLPNLISIPTTMISSGTPPLPDMTHAEL